MQKIDKTWFVRKLEESNKSMRGLARHLNQDASSISRTFSGTRRMQISEANEIAAFLGVPVAEVLFHAGIAIDLDGAPTNILLAATINESGNFEKLKDPLPLPQSVIDRAKSISIPSGDGTILAAQVRAVTGPLAVMDDAVLIFRSTDRVEPGAIGVLSICRAPGGDQFLAKIERARKTGEARVLSTDGKARDVMLDTAAPVLAVIP